MFITALMVQIVYFSDKLHSGFYLEANNYLFI